MENQKMQEPLVYRRILLTVDEDDNTSSERAFRYATTLAHDYDVPLGICSVLESEDMVDCKFNPNFWTNLSA